MATFEDLRDDLRAEEWRAKDCAFREMAWTWSEYESRECREKIEKLKRAISEALEANSECPIEAQRRLIIRYASKNGFDPDVCAESWIAHNSAKFRELWAKWMRNQFEIEARLPFPYKKRG